MSTVNLKNVPLKLFRQYLIFKGLKKIRTNGGHEIWGGTSVKRPITLQTHIDPIPEFIVRNNLRTLNVTKEEFYQYRIKQN